MVSGCSSGYPAVDTPALLTSLEKDLADTTKNSVKVDIATPVEITSFPMLELVCNDVFKTKDYQFDGVMMRAQVLKSGLKMPVGKDGSIIYKHEYAVCRTFYPVAEGAKQEAVYVKYLATIDATAAEMIPAIKNVEGGVDGLLQHTGFHLPLTVAVNGWSQIETATYKETADVQYLKMDPIEMAAVNKYDAEKFKNLLAFEMVSANVTMVGGKIVFDHVDIAVVENGMN